MDIFTISTIFIPYMESHNWVKVKNLTSCEFPNDEVENNVILKQFASLGNLTVDSYTYQIASLDNLTVTSILTIRSLDNMTIDIT